MAPCRPGSGPHDGSPALRKRRSNVRALRVAMSQGHSERVTSVATIHASAEWGWRLVTGSAEGTAKIWTETGEAEFTLRGHGGPVLCVGLIQLEGIGAAAWHVLTGSEDKTAKIWQLTDGTCTATLVGNGHSKAVTGVAARGRGAHARVLTASADKTIKVWTPTGESLATFRGHSGPILSLSSFEEAKGRWKFVSASADKTARLWSASGECLATFSGHEDQVSDVTAFEIAPGKWRLLTGSHDRSAKIWTLSGKCTTTLSQHTESINSVAKFQEGPEQEGPKQCKLLTGSADRTIKVWSANGDFIGSLDEHASGVTSVQAFEHQPGHWHIVNGSDDGYGQVWTTEGKPLVTLQSLAKLDVVTRLFTTFVSSALVLSFPFDQDVKWAEPVRPFQAVLPALRLAVPDLQGAYSTTFTVCMVSTIVYLVLVLGDVHGILTRWLAQLEESASEKGRSDSQLSATERHRKQISRIIKFTRFYIWLCTIVLLPAIVQTFIVAIDCRTIAVNGTSQYLWDHDDKTVCYTGNHMSQFTLPALILLPLYLFVAIRLSIDGGHIERISAIYQGFWIRQLTCGQRGCLSAWWAESAPQHSAMFTTTASGGRFSLLLQVSKIIMSISTDLLSHHLVLLGMLFTVLAAAIVVAAPYLPIYADHHTQAAYEALLVIDVWTCAIGTVTSIVDDETNAAPAWTWYAGVLLLPAIWCRFRATYVSRRQRKVAPSLSRLPGIRRKRSTTIIPATSGRKRSTTIMPDTLGNTAAIQTGRGWH